MAEKIDGVLSRALLAAIVLFLLPSTHVQRPGLVLDINNGPRGTFIGEGYLMELNVIWLALLSPASSDAYCE